MKVSLIQIFLGIFFGSLSLANDSKAQELLNKTVSLKVTNESLKSALNKVESIADVKFVYSKEAIKAQRKVSFEWSGLKLSNALDHLLAPLEVSYRIVAGRILLQPKAVTFQIIQEDQSAERNVGGKITDEKGTGLPGVSIILKGSSTGTVSDADGKYQITIPETGERILVFSFVGYLPKEVIVGNQTTLDVNMTVDTKALEEIIVVGYGTQRKRDITSAVSVINMEDIGEVPKSNVTRMLQGQAPGVIIKQKSGTPGQQFEVKVRGISSLGAGSDPLYVIDGFPVGISVGQNLNPNDIETITVLKDAASTAIYGARGSNGVVLITTKGAKEGRTSLNVSVDYGVQNIPDSRKTHVLNGPDFAQFKREVFIGRFKILPTNPTHRLPTEEEIPIDFRNPADTKYSTNWFDLILNNNAPYKDINLTLSSGKGPMKSVVSIGYYKEDGSLQYTGYDRASVRTNLSGDVNKIISMGMNIAGSYSKSSLANTDGRSNVVGLTLISDPRYPAYDAKGQLIPYYNGVGDIFGFPNPLFMLKNIKRNRNIADVLANGHIEFNLAKGLKFRSSVNAKINYNTYKEFVPSTHRQRHRYTVSGCTTPQRDRA